MPMEFWVPGTKFIFVKLKITTSYLDSLFIMGQDGITHSVYKLQVKS